MSGNYLNPDLPFSQSLPAKAGNTLESILSLPSHDRAGRAGAPLSSHSFSKNLKGYARAAGIEKIHIHQTRHTFARIVSEETGSIVETQDALGHKNLATTRVYIGRIAVKSDKHSRQVTARLNIR